MDRRCALAPALAILVVGLAPATHAQDSGSRAETWPREEREWPSPSARGEVDEEIDRALDQSLEDALRRPRRIEPSPESRREPWIDYGYEGIVRLEAWYLPVLGLRPDKDVRERDEGIELEADLKTSEGFMARLGFGDVGSIGLLGHYSRHRERKEDTYADVYGLYVDGEVGGALNEGPIELTLALGLGIGAVGFDFEDAFHDRAFAAFELRLQTGLRILEHFEVQATAGWFHWGWPGESVGNGGFLGLGVTLRF